MINLGTFFTFFIVFTVISALLSLYSYERGRKCEKQNNLNILLENKYCKGENERMKQLLVESGLKTDEDFGEVLIKEDEYPDDRTNGDYKSLSEEDK